MPPPPRINGLVVWLAHESGMSYRKIAKAFGVSHEGVRQAEKDFWADAEHLFGIKKPKGVEVRIDWKALRSYTLARRRKG